MTWRSFLFIIGITLLAAVFCSCKTEVGEGDKTWNSEVAPFRKTMDMGGYTLHYLDMGSGKPVVLVHGFADSSYSWNRTVQVLREEGNRLIIPDLPGLGLSDTPPGPYEFTIENQAKAVVDLTEKLGIKDFSIVGHCMGGGITLYIAQNHPHKVRKIAVIDPISYNPPAIQLLRLPGMEFLATNYGGSFAVRMGLEDAFYDSNRVSETMVNEYSRPMNKPGYFKTLISLEKQFYSPEFKRMALNHEKILRPTLIVWGREDTWVTKDEGVRLSKDIADSKLVILEKCGHNPHMECRDSVNPLLTEFLRDASPLIDPYLIRPGIGVGEIVLGMSREQIKKKAGKPVSSVRNGDQYEGFIVRYQDDTVSEILVTSPTYKTAEGITVDRPVERFLGAYPDTRDTCYEARAGGHVAHGVLRDALSLGIAYDSSSYKGRHRGETVTINVHMPGVPAKVYGKATDCLPGTRAQGK